MSNPTSKLEPFIDEIRQMAGTMSMAKVAAHYGVGATSVRRLNDKHGIWGDPANTNTTADPNTTSVQSDTPAEWGDAKTLIESRGMSLDDWIITGSSMTDWGRDPETGEPYHRLKVDLKPRLGMLMAARADGWRPPPRPALDRTKPHTVALIPDIHAPHHDPVAVAAVTEWLREHKPERGVIIGDLLDYDAVSRHRKNPKWSRTMEETLIAGYDIVRGFVTASPTTHWDMVDGNHEDRLRNAVIDHLPALQGLRRPTPPGATPEPEMLSTEFLLRFDELGINKIDVGGDEYTHAQVNLAPDLAVRHGWIARPGSGASALETLKRLRYSVVVAHTHRLGMVWFTTHDIDGTPKVVRALECGTLAKIPGGLGHAPEADWQQGIGVASVYPDGWFNLEVAPVVNGTLMHRDWRCNAGVAA